MRRFVIAALALLSIPLTTFAADAVTQPSADSLVKAVQESESWIDHVDSFYARFDGEWKNPPAEIARRRAQLAKQFPGMAIVEKHFPELKPESHDTLTLAFDRVRFYKSSSIPYAGTVFYDGHRVIGQTRNVDPPTENDSIESDPARASQFFFMYLSWLRAAKHDRWMSPEEGLDRLHKSEEHWEIVGREKFHGIDCWVLERDYGWEKWYVGVSHPLLYGSINYLIPRWDAQEIKAAVRATAQQLGVKNLDVDNWDTMADSLPPAQRKAARFKINRTVLQFAYPLAENFLLDYKEVSPGKWIPMTQGYTIWDGQEEPAIPSGYRTFKTVEIKINQPLPDSLFHTEFTEGATIYDATRNTPLSYKFKKHFTAAESQAILEKGQTSQRFWDDEKEAQDALIGKPAPAFPANCRWINTDKPLSWNQLKGHVVIVDFFAEWCGPCRNDLPTLAQLYTDRKTNGLTILAIHPPGSPRPAIDKVLKEFSLKYPICIDLDPPPKSDAWGLLYAAYAVHALPDAVVVNAKGNIAAHGSLSEVLTVARSLAKP